MFGFILLRQLVTPVKLIPLQRCLLSGFAKVIQMDIFCGSFFTSELQKIARSIVQVTRQHASQHGMRCVCRPAPILFSAPRLLEFKDAVLYRTFFTLQCK